MASERNWVIIEGRNPITEALRAGRKIREILVDEGVREKGLRSLEQLARERGIPVRRKARAEFRRLAKTAAPQGVIAFARPLEYASLEQVLQSTKESPGLLLVCDGIVDPHNLGALIRTADAAGCHGVIIPKHGAVGLTETVTKASAGAVEYVPIVRVTNLTRTLEALKKEGFWTVGASMEGDRSLWEADLRIPTAIVIGGEGAGLSRLVESHCDFLVSIPMLGQVNSLNASVAGALFMYEAMRQRRLTQA